MIRRLSAPALVALTISATLFLGLVVPVRSASYQPHPIILIDGNGSFTATNGVTSGSGTNTNPYIIDGWNITHPSYDVSNFYAIRIRNTNSYFTIRNVYLCGQGTSSIAVEFENVSNGQVQTASIPNCARSTTGIYIIHSANITIYRNDLSDARGLFLSYSSNVTVSANNFVFQCSSCYPSTRAPNIVDVEYSNNSIFSGNNFFGGSLDLSFSKGVHVYQNNFLDICDTCITIGGGVDSQGTLNSWDNGYPAGGNYWINYTGVDRCSGSAQYICTGPDGIGDTPYILGNVTDHYPLMRAHGDSGIPVWGPDARVLGSMTGQSTVSLSWSAAIDDLGIAGYRIYQNGQFLAATGRDRYGAVAESYPVNGLQSGTAYNFKVLAVDVANNTSAGGPSLDLTTPAQWWQVTSLAWWQSNWFYAAALIGSGAAIMLWIVLRGGKMKQKHLTDFLR